MIRRDRWAVGWSFLGPLLVASAALLAYLPTVAPTITWANGAADSGDLARAVLVAGIPHPPGYPTYVLAGLAWTRLPLPGDVAHRLAVLSAVGASLAVALTTATIMKLARPHATSRQSVLLGGVYGGLTLAWSPLLWSQAVVTEVYAPGLAWITLLGYLMLGGPLTTRRAVLAAACGGLGFGALPQVVLAGPSVLGVILAHFGLSGRTVRCLLLCVPAAGIGLLTLFYLPIRAAADPIANWGDPSSLRAFWEVVSAAQYRYVIGLLGPVDWLTRFREGQFQLGQNLLITGLLLALFGGRILWSTQQAEVGYLLSLFVLTVAMRTLYPAEGNLVYLIPALYAATVLAGLGLTLLLELSHRRFGLEAAWAVAGALIVLTAWNAIYTAPKVDASGDWTALSVAERVLDQAPPGAILLSLADETTFALWYVQALGQRPDVMVVDQRLLQYEWYREQLGRRYPDLILGQANEAPSASDRPRFILSGAPRDAKLRSID